MERIRLNVNKGLTFWVLALCAELLCGVPSFANDASTTTAQLEFFEREVRPLLVEHCYSCHSGSSEKLQAGLRVDSREALLTGGDSGPAIAPGDSEASIFIQAVRYESYEMPQRASLLTTSSRRSRNGSRWAHPWPATDIAAESNAAPQFDLLKRKTEHWVWQPIQSPTLPAVNLKSWPRESFDHFILAKLEANGLKPAGDVDRAALIRRLYFDLIGLPPTPEQVALALADDSEGATERLVDELLQSPHFGERWGRHWLDLVRYAESRGHEFDNDTPNAFQYRDYVIRAFNADVPYDQLVREHIAGDLLTSPRLNPQHGFNESILGTAFGS